MITTAGMLIHGSAFGDIPVETYQALGLSAGTATPKQLYDKLIERYKDPAQDAGKGKFVDSRKPVAIDQCWAGGT